ncbi:MAG: hypothetical protein K2X03_27320 [Bryobacteraceae bacterium]|nr:hypothetical protein [Bryobacteraceae bacterium]
MRAILTGALLAGVLDLADALVFFSNRGARPVRILQSIASGVQGVSAYRGGVSSAVLGIALHFGVALVAALGYAILCRNVRWVKRNLVQGGLLYGLGFYLFMNLVVLPLSAFPGHIWPPVVTSVFLNGVLAHLFLVGLPIAWAARRF